MSSTYQHIHFSIDDRIARITFAKPPLNVFNIAMMREITTALTQCAERELVAIVFDADRVVARSARASRSRSTCRK